VLNALRQPIEDGFVVIARAHGTTLYPANFQLLIAANPCPCGSPNGVTCKCSSLERRRYLGRLSGPLMDRIDLQVQLKPVSAADLSDIAAKPESSAQVAVRVRAARAAAAARWSAAGHPFQTNAAAPGSVLRQPPFRLPRKATARLGALVEDGNLSARGYDRVLRLAWTITDIDGRESPIAADVCEALELREGESP
jgi:magnesium chelatase family protein